MIYVTGDVHIPYDIHKLATKEFEAQKDMTKDDFVIVCGDFGIPWGAVKEDKWWLDWLNEKNFTTLFVDGNHENFDLLAGFPEEEWNGGTVHKLSDSVLHLMRGQVFELEGLKFFTMGGAESHDKECRKLGKSWWQQEMPCMEEYLQAVLSLEKADWQVDYVITHCMSSRRQQILNRGYSDNDLTDFFDEVEDKLSYRHWYNGHYHRDLLMDSRHSILYGKIERIV